MKSLSAPSLHLLTVEVLTKLDKFEFTVNLIVTDGLSTNVKLYKLLNDGKTLSHIVKHPIDGRPDIFLRFDPSHLIKNVNVQFLRRGFSKDGKVISGEFIKRMYEMQKDQLLKPVRNLTKKHIEPNIFEKQNAKRAVDIFSAEMIAAVDMYVGLDTADLVGSQETRHFFSQFHQWWAMHDIGSTY